MKKMIYIVHVADEATNKKIQICRRCQCVVLSVDGDKYPIWPEGTFVVEKMRWQSDHKGTGYNRVSLEQVSTGEVQAIDKYDFCLSGVEQRKEVEYGLAKAKKEQPPRRRL